MDEKRLRKRMATGIGLCAVLGIVVMIVSMFIIKSLYGSLDEIVREQMEKETVEYSNRIHRQINKDFQTLSTLASFIQNSGNDENLNMPQILRKVNEENEFVTMGYFDQNGIGHITHLEYGVSGEMNYRDFKPQVRTAIERAYRGERALSGLYESEVSDRKIYVYCVPIIKNGEVTAVLAASDNIEVFTTELGDDNVLHGNGVILLLNGEGRVLISAGDITVDTEMFTETYFSGEDVALLKESAALGHDSTFVSVYARKTGKSYTACLKKLGVNDWYLLCIHDKEAANKTASTVVNTMAVTFCLIVIMVLVLLVFIVSLILRSNRHLNILAYRDRLTGADNRSSFEKNLMEFRKRDPVFCIAYLNVRQFKFINEIFGTAKANELLRTISQTIEESLEEGEFFARITADQFCIYLKESSQKRISYRLNQMIRKICENEEQRKKDYHLQMYSGAYIHNEQSDPELSCEMLMTRASFAMEHCRNQTTGQIHFYDAEIHKDEEMENYVESHMHQALENGEFRLFLQPKKDLHTGELGGAEALVRWQTQENGMIFPNVFIPQFEKNGFCVKLDLYMIEAVVRQLREWMDEGLKPIPVSVNQSKLLFYEADYLPRLKRLLEQYRIPARLVTLEILEGLALDNPGEINDKLRELRELGFMISMDDFGSGYSSFHTLGNLEIDELKLDRSFLLEASKESTGRFRTIMASILDLCKRLRISTVTEGVETQEDEALIRELGCDFGQGYLYSRPISAEEFTDQYMRKNGGCI